MRRIITVSSSLMLFAACNGLLGNEDHYTLQGPELPDAASGTGGGAGAATSGASGNAGAATSGASGSAGAATSGASGSAGAATSGASGSAGLSGTSGASGSAGLSGTSGASGSAGVAGSGPCVPSGAENCLNGLDDDCNGDTDCADIACGGSTMCVPAAVELGTFPATGTTCPTGYTAVTLHRGLSADPLCAGCTCQPLTARCDSSLGSNATNGCPGYTIDGVTYDVYTTSCSPVTPGSLKVHYYDVTGFAECTPQGTATPSAVMWAETRTFCKANSVGGGCPTSEACVAKTASTLCSLTSGSAQCAGGYPTTTGAAWDTGVSDTRTCGACQCSFGTSACGNAGIALYSSTDCSGNPYTLPGVQGDNCALPFMPKSGKALGAPASSSCPPSTYPSGTLKEAGPSTVCCQ